MEITGKQSVAASRQQVWDALNDPVVLKACLPGCESVERSKPDEFQVLMAVAIGPLRARFKGMLRMTEVHAPASCVMIFEGQGGPMGFGKGSSSVTLAEEAGVTELGYTAHAEVGGKLAQVGSRLIDSVARKMADDFFAALRKQLVPVMAAPVSAAIAPASAPAIAPASARDTVAQPTARVEAVKRIEPSAMAGLSPKGGPTLVPGWWLAVAVALGAATSLAGVMLAH